MSKAVLISIQPKWCELIAKGIKTVEVRKTKPKLSTPFKVYIYCTNDFSNHATKSRRNKFWVGEPINDMSKGRYLGNGKVIGEFVCDRIDEIRVVDSDITRYVIVNDKVDMYITDDSRLSVDELYDYLWPKKGFAWHISNLVIYDKPKELGEFKKVNRKCWYADLGLAKRDCPECKNAECFLKRAPQSWCYVEELKI